jgi:hypothetical protein
MKISLNHFVSLIVCALILCAGCTQPASQVPAAQVTVPVTTVDPAQMILTESDMPQGFTLIESRTKTPEDLSQLAMELGWQGGHVVRFIRPARNETQAAEIIQTVTIYPSKNIPNVIALAEKQGRSSRDMTYADVPVTGIGDNARGFTGLTGLGIIIEPTDANPVMAGLNNNEAQPVSLNNFTEIMFSKGDTFEVFTMTGVSPDTAQVIDLAQKAYAKIP